MIITLKLYKNHSDKTYVKKNIELVDTISNVVFKESTSLRSPTFILKRGVTVGGEINFNYIYCENTKRYYYIVNKVFRADGLLELECHTDVLMTFKSDILASTQRINRAEKMVTPCLIDQQLPFNNGTFTEVYNINNNKYYSNHISFLLKIGGAYGG